ncbi:F-type conjugal transfer pilus assembly protein TraB [Escherichia coli]|uniref:F-type conjugal transfer pilus assembly protein TraB n=1 Tax=Escherichia coli TaxID=562 RepID=UPI0008FD2CD0|nr:F-type conjugal transfer pilus assembly protein TraB [Escherichia coli]
MASINTIVKRKQYLWLGIVVVGTASAIGGALYLSDVDMSGNGETVAEQEPVPDMTGVVDTTFDDKVRQHATTEMQVTAAQMQKQYEEIRRELDVLNKQRGDDQRRIEKLGQDNAALAEQVKALGANPVTATGEPVPQMPASPPGPEGEPQPGNTPVSFPPQGSVAVPPPTAFYPGNGVTPPPQVTYQSVPVPNRIQRKVFTRNEGKQGPSLPYIPSGSFAKAMLIEGADANASVTGNESTVPMQLRITGLVEMPNSKTYDATGCFVGLEAWGDVSSERAIVRTRNISCLKDGKTIDMPIKGHVSFRGKNGIPEVVSGEDVTQAEQPQQPVSPAINDKKSDSGVNVPAGGIEQELKMKPEEEMEQQLPPGISESGEVVDMAAYEAWQQENHPDIQQQMQRREEVNINVHRERGEDVEPGDDF